MSITCYCSLFFFPEHSWNDYQWIMELFWSLRVSRRNKKGFSVVTVHVPWCPFLILDHRETCQLMAKHWRKRFMKYCLDRVSLANYRVRDQVVVKPKEAKRIYQIQSPQRDFIQFIRSGDLFRPTQQKEAQSKLRGLLFTKWPRSTFFFFFQK